MTRRALTVILAVVMLSAILAFALRDVIQRTIVLPILYLWWVLGIVYHSIPQFVLWVVLVVLVFFVAAGSVIPDDQFRGAKKDERKRGGGPIESLAVWIGKTRGGIYYKWLVAHRLGKLARELLAQREGRGRSKSFGRLNGRDWNPPDEVDAYLESGLNGSFSAYPQPRWPWLPARKSPLDLSPQDAVEFLESEMEAGRDGHR
ncbi:MAG: hypothetical protein HZB19_09570 [Chloroflexi bacterium]|nr:hypothetical protein [Chloroflexota bacterium]